MPAKHAISRAKLSLTDHLLLEQLFHLGLATSVIQAISENSGKRELAILTDRYINNRRAELMKSTPLVCSQLNINKRNNSYPSLVVKKISTQRELSLLSSIYYYLFGDSLFENPQGLDIQQFTAAFSMYTNISTAPEAERLSVNLAFWLSRELLSLHSEIVYCPHCHVHYYYAENHIVSTTCPFCRQKGQSIYQPASSQNATQSGTCIW